MDWFYADSGKQIGPVDDAVFRNLAAAGIIRNDTLVWRAGMATWQQYQTIEMPAHPPPLQGVSGGQQFCSECGKPYPADKLVAFGSSLVCASCKPLFTQKLREGILPKGSIRYGGFWLRYVAVLVDSTLLSIVLYILGMIVFAIMFAMNGISWIDPKQPQQEFIVKVLILEGVAVLVNAILGAVYEIWMVTRYGGTLGKIICRLRVVMVDGSSLSYGRSAGRHFAKYISGLTLLIGYIMAGVDEEKRALHDRICDTRVIKK